jgi:hypothetical protein
MKKLHFAALAFLSVSAASAQAGLSDQDIRSRQSHSLKSVSGKEMLQAGASADPALREVAQGLAAALGERQIRHLVKQEVGKKFDGDFDVLYREVANHKIGSVRTFRQALGSAVGQVRKRQGKLASQDMTLQDLDYYATALPQLQISMPVGFDDWDVESTVPLVAYVPAGVDDNDLKEIEAFDANGRRHLLDAQIEPDFPVVIIGLNERTDRNGYLRREFVQSRSGSTDIETMTLAFTEDPSDPGGDVPYEPPPPPYSAPPPSGCDARTHAYGDQEFLHQVKINNDHEPWVKGSPEIYATYGFVDNQGIRGQFFLSNVDAEGSWYSINGPLFYWQSYYGNTFAMAIWEQDGSNYGTFTYNFGGLNYTLQIHDGDDSLGATAVSFLDPVCGSYSTGDAEFKLRYQGATSGSGCGEASCVAVQGTYISHFTGTGCTGTESYYLPYDGYGYACRTWNGTGQCGAIHRTVTNRSYRYNGTCYDAWPSGNTLSDFVTIYR